MMGSRLLAPLFLMISLSAHALEPQNPVALCERFLIGPPKEACEKKMKSLKPDWYLATVCNENFDDQAFYDCVGLTKLGNYSPLKLEVCGGSELSDLDRIACVRSASSNSREAFQQRAPASAKKIKKKK